MAAQTVWCCGHLCCSTLFGRNPWECLLPWINRNLAPGWQRQLFGIEPSILRGAAWLSALLGTLSHLGLDSIMHTDVVAIWPIHSGNPIQGTTSLEALHALCVAAAVMAMIIAQLVRQSQTPLRELE